MEGKHFSEILRKCSAVQITKWDYHTLSKTKNTRIIQPQEPKRKQLQRKIRMKDLKSFDMIATKKLFRRGNLVKINDSGVKQ